MSAMASAGFPFVTAEEAIARVSVDDALAILERAFRAYGEGRTALSAPSALGLSHPEVESVFKIKGAMLVAESLAGFRLICDRPADGSDWHYVFNAHSGKLKGVVDEKKLHWRRTAVSGVLAAKWLARQNARIFAILGAGNIANELPQALSRCFDMAELRIATRRFERAEAFVRAHDSTGGTPLRACRTIEEAISGADVVLSITSAEQPVLFPTGLKPGATVVGLGGEYEIDSSVLDWANLFVVDDMDFATVAGSVAGWLRMGSIERASIERRLAGTIGDVALGRITRSSADERVLAIVQGMAIGDLALADAALARGQA